MKIDSIDYLPVRYVHAEFDMDSCTFRHFDGAFHFYTEEEEYSEDVILTLIIKEKRILKLN